MCDVWFGSAQQAGGQRAVSGSVVREWCRNGGRLGFRAESASQVRKRALDRP